MLKMIAKPIFSSLPLRALVEPAAPRSWMGRLSDEWAAICEEHVRAVAAEARVGEIGARDAALADGVKKDFSSKS